MQQSAPKADPPSAVASASMDIEEVEAFPPDSAQCPYPLHGKQAPFAGHDCRVRFRPDWDHGQADPELADDQGEGEGDFELPPTFDIDEEAMPSGLAPLVRRDIEDDAVYALHPDVALMRAERLAADLGVEAALIMTALGRRP